MKMRNILSAIVISMSMITGIFASDIWSINDVGVENKNVTYRSLVKEALENTKDLSEGEKARVVKFVLKVEKTRQSYGASTGYAGEDHPWYAESAFYKSKKDAIGSYNFPGDNGSKFQDLQHALSQIDREADQDIEFGLIRLFGKWTAR